MPESFLDTLRRLHGGAQAGPGPDGGTDSNLADDTLRHFMFATGIECSYPKVQGGRVRRDELEECGHYTHWRQDFGLVKELGAKVLRYGLPYYRVHLGPGRYDWSFADEVLSEMQSLGITPILDLLHFGLPDWLGSFQNPEFPARFAEYAEAVSIRYPWVRFYTPVNEIFVTTMLSAKEGIWNEALKSDRGFATAMKHLVAACLLAFQAITRHRPDAVFVQSESAEKAHYALAQPGADLVMRDKLRFLSFDLLYGRWPEGDVCLFLMDNGFSREELEWFMRQHPYGYQIMGNDYYRHNERIFLPGGGELQGQTVMGWYQITHEYYLRYRKPIMHTETNLASETEAAAWMWNQWVNILEMRSDGIPVLGFTWYGLIDFVDWDTAMTQAKGTVIPCGLFGLDRRPHPVAKAFRQLIEEYGNMPIVPHAEVFEMTDQARSRSRL